MRKLAGFTLIELVMVMVIIGILAAISSVILSQGFNAYFAGKNVTDASWQGVSALEHMARDIRAIRSPSDITAATTSQLVFTNISGSSITYQLSGTTLMRNSQPLADGIQSLTFSYFSRNGAVTATPSLICYIRITLNVTQNNSDFTMTTAIYP